MRIIYFLIAVAVLAGVGGGFYYLAQEFNQTWGSAVDARVQSKLLEIELLSRGRIR